MPQAPGGHKLKLLDQVREAIRMRHYSMRTEEAYVRRFIFFHGKRHPLEMGADEITRFLSALAVQGHVSASTQNQALCALVFLYRHVLGLNLGWLDDVVRAKRPQRLPIVLTRSEVKALLGALEGVHWIMASLYMGLASAFWSVCVSERRISISPATRSWSARERATRIGERCCRQR